jgi:hypothetical protein
LTITVSIPQTFLQDAQDGIWDQAEHDPRFARLIEKIEASQPVKRGRGFSRVVDLEEDEFAALRSEANYKDQYWNTDAYGIKEAGSTIPSYAAAAKRLARRLNALAEIQPQV